MLTIHAQPERRILPHITRSNAEIDAAVRAEIREVVRGDKPWPMFFEGPAGTGKTCAALCLLDHARCGRYWVMADLLAHLIQVNAGQVEYGHAQETQAGFWKRFAWSPLVVVDEIGARSKASDFHYETLKRAIDARHGAPLVLVSNTPLSDLTKIYDDRIASRIAGGTVVKFGGHDRRVKR